MILHVRQLRETEELCFDIESHQCDLPADIGEFVTPIHLDAHIRKVKEEITIEGRIAVTVEMNCARCLELHHERIDDSFEVVYCPRPDDEEQGDEIELDETDLDISYYEGESIAIPDLLREQLLMMLPVKPLCKPDCAGLCPSCGKNLNKGSCTCSRRNIDSRFAILENLLEQHVSKK
jgi:uncharacterized protein